MWSCATTDTAHAQRSYLTVARLPFADWRFNWRLEIPIQLSHRISRPNFPLHTDKKLNGTCIAQTCFSDKYFTNKTMLKKLQYLIGNGMHH